MNAKQAELLRKAAQEAEKHPDEFNMNHWVETNFGSWCGTTGCLAYEICRVNGESGKDLFRKGGSYVRDEAIRLLQALGPGELSRENIMQMFGTSAWPYESRVAYHEASRVTGVKNMIERFIAGDGSFNPPPITKKVEEVLVETRAQPNYLDNNRAPELDA